MKKAVNLKNVIGISLVLVGATLSHTSFACGKNFHRSSQVGSLEFSAEPVPKGLGVSAGLEPVAPTFEELLGPEDEMVTPIAALTKEELKNVLLSAVVTLPDEQARIDLSRAAESLTKEHLINVLTPNYCESEAGLSIIDEYEIKSFGKKSKLAGGLKEQLAFALRGRTTLVRDPVLGNVVAIKTPIPGNRHLNLQDKRVLIVEDQLVNQKIAKKTLALLGMTSDIAEDGIVGLEKALNSGIKYDFILMDHDMPRLNGLQATRFIRGMSETVPIISLTANPSPDLEEQYYNAGVTQFLKKPINLKKIAQIFADITNKVEETLSLLEPTPRTTHRRSGALQKLRIE